MGRGPTTKRETVEFIETMWAENLTKTAVEIHQMTSNVSPRPSLRKVQQIIRDARRGSQPVTNDPPLQPWGEGWPESSKDIACLFRLMFYLRLLGWPDFTQRQARWALTLRQIFDTGDQYSHEGMAKSVRHICWADVYAQRERAAEVLGRDLHYDDLDARMMFRDWEGPCQREAYLQAVRKGLIPQMRFDLDDERIEHITPSENWDPWKIVERIIQKMEEDHQREECNHGIEPTRKG